MQVRVNRIDEAEGVFSTLMDGVVELCGEFIQQKGLMVANLGV